MFMMPTGSGPGTGWVDMGGGVLRNATNGDVAERGSYFRFASDQDFAPPYVWSGKIRTISLMEPPVFSNGTPAWYEPGLVFHPMYGSSTTAAKGNDENVLIGLGGAASEGHVGISAELRAERPDTPYGARSGYVNRVRGVAPTPFFDGAWHLFDITVHSHAHYTLQWDGVIMADVEEKLPATMAGRNRVGLRADFLGIEIKDFSVTTIGEPAAVSVHPREDWQDPAQPVTGPAAKSAGGTWVIHYPGGGSFEPRADAEVAAYLRSVQSSYINGRGYSIGYSFGVAQSGSAWQIRGHDFNPASNPGRKLDAGNFNDRSRSIFVMVGDDNQATPEAVKAINTLIATRPGWQVVTHGDVDYTSCCGVGMIGQVRAGIIGQQITPPPPPTEEDDDMLAVVSLIRPQGYANVFAVTPMGSRHLGGDSYVRLTAQLDQAGYDSTIYVTDHEQEIKGILSQAGLTHSDLVAG
jgi:hypothetical protein